MNDKLNRVIVPMPQFVNPNNPETNAGSINLHLDTHPVEHDESYGAGVSEEDVVGIEEDADTQEDEWTKDDYKEALAKAGLPVSGNKEELVMRWAEYKANNPDESDEQ